MKKLITYQNYSKYSKKDYIPPETCIYPRYKERETRFKSYTITKSNITKVNELSDSGFFYAGTESRVICFQCGLCINIPSEYSKPIIEHAMLSENCEYILNVIGGKKFLKNISESYIEYNNFFKYRTDKTIKLEKEFVLCEISDNENPIFIEKENIYDIKYVSYKSRYDSIKNNFKLKLLNDTYDMATYGFYTYSNDSRLYFCFCCPSIIIYSENDNKPGIIIKSEDHDHFTTCSFYIIVKGHEYMKIKDELIYLHKITDKDGSIGLYNRIKSDADKKFVIMEIIDNFCKKFNEKHYNKYNIIDLIIVVMEIIISEDILKFMFKKYADDNICKINHNISYYLNIPYEVMFKYINISLNKYNLYPTLLYLKYKTPYLNCEEFNKIIKKIYYCRYCNKVKKSCIFLNCLHIVYCIDCAETLSLKKCVICNSDIVKIEKIYMN